MTSKEYTEISKALEVCQENITRSFVTFQKNLIDMLPTYIMQEQKAKELSDEANAMCQHND